MEETGPERRTVSSQGEDERSRTGMPASITSPDMGLATVIGRANEDASGRAISGEMRSTVERMRTWDSRSRVRQPVDRNLRQAFSELERLSDRLSVSEAVTEKAAYTYRKALECGLVRGRSISAIMAASLYAACRDREVPRTLKDMAEVSDISRTEIARSYRLLLREMDIKVPVANPLKCVTKIGSRARMGEKTQRKALEILVRAEMMMVTAGKDPMGLAASALYVASMLEGGVKTQRDIADAARVTEVTLRNRYKGLREALEI